MTDLLSLGLDLANIARDSEQNCRAASLGREIHRSLGLGQHEALTLKTATERGFNPTSNSEIKCQIEQAPHQLRFARALAEWIGVPKHELWPASYEAPAAPSLTRIERFRLERRAFRQQFIKGPRARAVHAQAIAQLRGA